MKILITTDWYLPAINGVVTSVLNLADGLRAAGHDVRILTLSASRSSHVDKHVYYVGSVGVGKIYPKARMRAALAAPVVHAIIRWKPDVVHSQCEFSTYFMAKKISRVCGCPLVHTYHTVYEDYTKYFSPNAAIGKRMACVFSRRVLAGVNGVVVPTGKVRSLLRRYRVKAPIYEVPTGLELERLMVRSQTPSVCRKDLGLSDDDFVMLYLGRLGAEKNIGELIDLAASSAPNGAKLLLVGDGPYRGALEDQVKRLGIEYRVIFAGMAPPEHIADYYRLGDIFVSASQSETQGLTYLEAMACGLPLLCRRDDCLNALIKHGENGYMYSGADEFGMIAAQLEGSGELRERIALAAEKTIKEHYSKEAFASKMIKVYEEVLERQRYAEMEADGGSALAVAAAKSHSA